MSTLIENVQKVKNAHAALKTAIEGKGVAVPAGTKLTGMPALVEQIQTGGGGGSEGGYLTFTAGSPTSTINLMQWGSIAPHKLLKSTDAQNWTKWENPSTNEISLKAGESVYIKADEDALNRMATGNSNYNYFRMTGRIACTGDAAQLVKIMVPSDYQWCFFKLFYSCDWLTQAPELTAYALSDHCYAYMFQRCESLKQAPELPTKTLHNYCYDNMFYGCNHLKRIKMNASSGNWGFNMFNSCTQLELVDMTDSTGVPNLQSTNNFDGTNDTYKVVVPDSLYDTWIAATNWSAIASHIMKQSDWNAAHPDDQL